MIGEMVIHAVERPVSRRTCYGWITKLLTAEMPCGHAVALYAIDRREAYLGRYGFGWDSGSWEPNGLVRCGPGIKAVTVAECLVTMGFMLPVHDVEEAVKTLLATADLMGISV